MTEDEIKNKVRLNFQTLSESLEFCKKMDRTFFKRNSFLSDVSRVTITTKPARIGSDKIYLTKARDFLKGAIMEEEKENWNSAAVLSIHAVISACDAICTKF